MKPVNGRLYGRTRKIDGSGQQRHRTNGHRTREDFLWSRMPVENSNTKYLEHPKTLATPLPLFTPRRASPQPKGRERSGINRQAGPCSTRDSFSYVLISSLPYFNLPLSYRSSSTCLFLPYLVNMAGPALPLKATVNCDMGEVRLRRSYLF